MKKFLLTIFLLFIVCIFLYSNKKLDNIKNNNKVLENRISIIKKDTKDLDKSIIELESELETKKENNSDYIWELETWKKAQEKLKQA